jgi:hypothetical protein
MIRSALRRFAGDSFPPELRLEVMKASVLYHAPMFQITFESTFDDVAKAAKKLFDQQHTTNDVSAILQQTAEQALLETCIFKVQKVERMCGSSALNFTHSMAPLFDVIDARIHHLEIFVQSGPSYRCVVAIGKARDATRAEASFSRTEDLRP